MRGENDQKRFVTRRARAGFGGWCTEDYRFLPRPTPEALSRNYAAIVFSGGCHEERQQITASTPRRCSSPSRWRTRCWCPPSFTRPCKGIPMVNLKHPSGVLHKGYLMMLSCW